MVKKYQNFQASTPFLTSSKIKKNNAMKIFTCKDMWMLRGWLDPKMHGTENFNIDFPHLEDLAMFLICEHAYLSCESRISVVHLTTGAGIPRIMERGDHLLGFNYTVYAP